MRERSPPPPCSIRRLMTGRNSIPHRSPQFEIHSKVTCDEPAVDAIVTIARIELFKMKLLGLKSPSSRTPSCCDHGFTHLRRVPGTNDCLQHDGPSVEGTGCKGVVAGTSDDSWTQGG